MCGVSCLCRHVSYMPIRGVGVMSSGSGFGSVVCFVCFLSHRELYPTATGMKLFFEEVGLTSG